ncbi:MAG: hypothetical protein KFH87_06680 [Bacteroidetes bacterium]|nr:hypothetical protein [Bacteroidota bacterium]
MDDVYHYSIENVRTQIAAQSAVLGVYELRFYVEGGRPSRENTGQVDTFYYYPSGGTIRDRDMNIMYYEPKLDIYHTSSRDA